MKDKAFILVSAVAVNIIVTLFVIAMVTVSYNRYQQTLRYADFIEGYNFANIGLSRLRYIVRTGTFPAPDAQGVVKETFTCSGCTDVSAIDIIFDLANQTAEVRVIDPRAGVRLDVAYQGQTITSYSVRKE